MVDYPVPAPLPFGAGTLHAKEIMPVADNLQPSATAVIPTEK
jgi:hypothetical protein